MTMTCIFLVLVCTHRFNFAVEKRPINSVSLINVHGSFEGCEEYRRINSGFVHCYVVVFILVWYQNHRVTVKILSIPIV